MVLGRTQPHPVVPVKVYNLNDQEEMSDILQSNWPLLFKNFKVMEDKESEQLIQV